MKFAHVTLHNARSRPDPHIWYQIRYMTGINTHLSVSGTAPVTCDLSSIYFTLANRNGNGGRVTNMEIILVILLLPRKL